MTPGEAFRRCFGQYAVFAGRAPRAEFWWFQLPWLLWVALSVFFVVIAAPTITRHGHLSGEAAILAPYYTGLSLVFALYALAALIPSVAVLVRRLHDTGLAGWWALVVLVPLGGLVLTILVLVPGTQGPNRFGPDPRPPQPR